MKKQFILTFVLACTCGVQDDHSSNSICSTSDENEIQCGQEKILFKADLGVEVKKTKLILESIYKLNELAGCKVVMFTQDNESGENTFSFIDQNSMNQYDKSFAGVTVFKASKDPKILYSTNIYLLVKSCAICSEQQDNDLIVEVWNHELGHALGLNHSLNTTKLMYHELKFRLNAEKMLLKELEENGIDPCKQ